MISTSKKIRILSKIAAHEPGHTPAAAAPSIDWSKSNYRQRIAFRKQHGRSKAYKQGMRTWWKAHVERKRTHRKGLAVPSVPASPKTERLAQGLKRRVAKGFGPSHGLVRDESVAPFKPQRTLERSGTILSRGPKSRITVGKPKASILGQEGVRAAPTLITARKPAKFKPLFGAKPADTPRNRAIAAASTKRKADESARYKDMNLRLKLFGSGSLREGWKPPTAGFKPGSLRGDYLAKLKGQTPRAHLTASGDFMQRKAPGQKHLLHDKAYAEWQKSGKQPTKSLTGVATR